MHEKIEDVVCTILVDIMMYVGDVFILRAGCVSPLYLGISTYF